MVSTEVFEIEAFFRRYIYYHMGLSHGTSLMTLPESPGLFPSTRWTWASSILFCLVSWYLLSYGLTYCLLDLWVTALSDTVG